MLLLCFFSVLLATVPNGNTRQNGDTGNRFSKRLFYIFYIHEICVSVIVYLYNNLSKYLDFPGQAETHLHPVTQKIGL